MRHVLQGSGLSDGKWVTLGAHEVEDLSVVVQHLRSQGGVSSIGLWGRSMGAVTALMYSHRDPDIAGMVSVALGSRVGANQWVALCRNVWSGCSYAESHATMCAHMRYEPWCGVGARQSVQQAGDNHVMPAAGSNH
jgi:pimeloyl-ACP methyl ester carboxylesterase